MSKGVKGTKRVDDWPITRGKHQHFTEDEKAVIQRGFRDGTKAEIVARQLLCATRSVHAWYMKLRGGVRQHRATPAGAAMRNAKPKSKAALPDRYYHSTFTPI